MKTLPLLIQALQHSTSTSTSTSKSPKELFRLYKGTDWKEHVRYVQGTTHCYPTILWKDHTMELRTMGWCKDQSYRTYTNYNVMYSHLLEGSLFSDELYDGLRKTCFIQTHSWHTTMPFTIVDMKAPMKAASLHLIHYSPYSPFSTFPLYAK